MTHIAPRLTVIGLALAATAACTASPTSASTPVPSATATVTVAPTSAAATATPSQEATESSAATAPAQPMPTTSSAGGSAALTETFCIPKEGLCFQHPAGWRFTVEDAHAYGGDNVLLYNPAGKLVYYLATGVTQIGGSCGDAPHPHEVLSVDPTELTGYASQPGTNADRAAVITSVSTMANGWRTKVAISTLPSELTVGASDTCDLFSFVIPGRMKVGEKGSTTHTWNSRIAFGNNRYLTTNVSADVDQVLPTKEQAIAALRGNPDLPTIVQILKSAHYA